MGRDAQHRFGIAGESFRTTALETGLDARATNALRVLAAERVTVVDHTVAVVVERIATLCRRLDDWPTFGPGPDAVLATVRTNAWHSSIACGARVRAEDGSATDLKPPNARHPHIRCLAHQSMDIIRPTPFDLQEVSQVAGIETGLGRNPPPALTIFTSRVGANRAIRVRGARARWRKSIRKPIGRSGIITGVPLALSKTKLDIEVGSAARIGAAEHQLEAHSALVMTQVTPDSIPRDDDAVGLDMPVDSIGRAGFDHAEGPPISIDLEAVITSQRTGAPPITADIAISPVRRDGRPIGDRK
jgi:hypothetical protein